MDTNTSKEDEPFSLPPSKKLRISVGTQAFPAAQPEMKKDEEEGKVCSGGCGCCGGGDDDDDEEEELDLDSILVDDNSGDEFCAQSNVQETATEETEPSEAAKSQEARGNCMGIIYARATGIAELKNKGITVPGLSSDDVEEVVKAFESPSYESLQTSQIKQTMSILTDSVVEATGMARDTAIIMLRRSHWNAENVIERYLTEKDAFLEEIGLSYRAESTEADAETVTCTICYDDVPISDTTAIECGHRFCNRCWREGLKAKMTEGWASSIVAQCLGYGCKYPLPDSVILGFLDESDRKKFHDASVRQFVQEDPHYKECPGRGCDYVTYAKGPLGKAPVMCFGCNFVFCFQCNDYDIGDHRPCTCEQMAKWNERTRSESENIKWLTANAKQCPRCHVYIEKNEGCMHMTCRKEIGGCGYEWCWLCRGPWSEHSAKTGGYYACNKYDKSSAKKIDDEASKVKEELKHYMFYFHRYTAHKDTHTKALKYLRDMPEKERHIRELYEKSGSRPPTNFMFLFDAVSTIIESCRTLAYSYVYGYFMKHDDPKEQLFLFSQENLEKFAVRLTEMFEQKTLSVADFEHSKQELINMTKVTLNYLESFNERIKEVK